MTLRAVSPAPQESLLGFLRTVSDVNGYRHLSGFTERIGMVYGRPMIENLPALAGVLGLDLAMLEAVAPQARSGEASRDWRFQRTRSDPFCPACLAEGSVWRQAWRHSLVSACPTHGLRLQDTCPSCRERLTPTKGGFRICDCGTPLAGFPAIEATHDECLVAALLSPDTSRRLRGPFDGIDTLPTDLGGFLHFLAASQSPGRSEKVGKTPLPPTVEATVAFMEPVATMLSDWPERFDAEVHERLQNGPAEAATAPARLGGWYQRLMRFRDPAYAPFRERVGIVIGESFDGPYVGALVSDEDRAWVSAAQAAREIGVRAERIVAAVASGRLPGRQHQSGIGHRHTVVRREMIGTIRENRQRFLTAKDAAAGLGVSKRQFQLLREAGLVREVPEPERPPLVDGAFDRTMLDALVGKVRGRVGASVEGETIPFREIDLRRTTELAAIIALLQTIERGEIPPTVAGPDDDLGAFLFDKEDIAEFLRSRKSPASYSAIDVARITGWKHECVAHWCREGFLECDRDAAGTILIAPRALAQFQKRYAFVGDLAAAMNTSSRDLIRRLGEAGVEVIGAKDAGGARRCCLVQLTDAIGALLMASNR